MTQRRTLSNNKIAVVGCLLFLLNITVRAAEFVQSVSREGSQIGLTQQYNPGAPQSWDYNPYVVYDQFFQTPTPNNALRDIYITGILKLNDRNRVNYPNNWRLDVTYTIKLYNANNTLTQTLTGEKLSINYYKNANYEDQAQKIYRSGTANHRATIEITQIKTVMLNADGSVNSETTPSSLGALFRDVSLEWQCTSVRNLRFNPNTQPVVDHVSGTTVNPSPVCETNVPDNIMRLAWGYIPGAESYDVEWLFLDIPPTAVTTAGITLPAVNTNMAFDWRNATRVNVTGTMYDVPLLYPTGVIVYRVRGIGVDIDNNFLRTEGKWSRVPSAHVYKDNLSSVTDAFVFCGLEYKQNWTATLSFAEEGKRKGVVSFVDGTGKTRQTITTLNTDQNTIVAEPSLDNMGRPAVNFLPVAVRGEHFTYFNDFNGGFDATVYDSPGSYPSGAPVAGIPPSANSAVDDFYSSANPIVNLTEITSPTPYDEYLAQLTGNLPDAKHYPFVQTRMLNDGSGRPHGTSGVGDQHMLGAHDTRYVYGSPGTQAEVDRLFGSEAGFVSYYKKNMVIDPNGQVSVAYLDGYGRTVATALAGTNTDDRLVSVAQPPVPITGSLLDNNTPLPNGTLVATKDITVAVPNTVYTFSYAISQTEYETACLGNYGCKFEFLITVKDHEGNSITPTTAPPGYGPTTWCDADVAPSPYVLDYTLPVGKFTITKTLRIKQTAYQNILTSVDTAIGSDYANANACFTPPFESGCFDCATQCVNSYKYAYTHGGQTYWIYRNLGAAGPDYTNETSLLAVTDILGNPIFQMPGNIAAIMAEADAAITACQDLCTQTPTINTGTECEMKRILLLRDLLPDGQYFENRPKDPEYTGIANADYLTGSETDADNRNAWLTAYASGLLDDFNALLNPPAPSNTSWEYVRAHWSEIDETGAGFTALKEQLIQLHPEYCIWKSFCESADDTCLCKSGQPAPYGSPQDYNDRMNSVHTDQEAIDQLLFIPQGTQPMYWDNGSNQSASPYIPAGGVDWDLNCHIDPILLNCDGSGQTHTAEINNRLQTYMQVPVPGGTRNISVWYIISDPEDLRLYNPASGPHPVYPGSFVQYMQTLHGSPATPQGLLAPLNTAPLSGQISRWQFFRSLYSGFRSQLENQLAMVKVGACLPQNHPLAGVMDLCDQGFGDGYDCDRLPYLSVWDNDDDGYLDTGGGSGFSFDGIQLRYPYIALLDGLSGNMADQVDQMEASYCESNCSALATQWINQMQNGIRACVNPGTEGGNPVTPSFVFDDAQRQLLRDYFINICGKSCQAQTASGTYTNDFTQFAGMAASDWTGFGMGAHYPASSSNVIQTVQQVVDRFMEYNGNAEGCPVIINTTPTGGQPAPSPDDLACVCNNISEFIYENNGLKNGYGLVNPLKWQTITSNANTVFDFTNITTGLDELGYTTNGHTQQLVLHWLSQCNTNSSAVINDITVSSVNYTLPADFLCQQPPNGFDDLGELDCAQTEQEQAVTVNSLAFNLFKQEQLDSFRIRYPNSCLEQARSLETFTVTYSLDEYHYTLYYYDQAGNLVKTVPPAGVAIITNQQDLADIAAFRLAHHHEDDYADQTGFKYPGHFNVTNYVYNGQNQVIKQTTPDGGATQFFYDGLGRLVLSQNAKQAANPKKYSYTLFDGIGRITEVGEMPLEVGSDRVTIQRFVEGFAAAGQAQTPFELLVYNNRALKTQMTITHYDMPATDQLGIPTLPFGQQNLRNRVSASGYFAVYPSDQDTRQYDNATFYSYDIHGNVNSVAQDIPALQQAKRRFLRTDYRYDLVSGKVNEVHYMKGFAEQFSHYYQYDADNRITGVYTSKNGGIIKELEAKYFYYPTGPLARVELGRAQVQGMDYAYTIHGWLKGVNADETSTRADIGKDANHDNNNLHALFGMDAAGFTLGYYGGDYTAIGNNGAFEASMATSAALPVAMHPNMGALADWGLYNGNISKMVSTGLDCAEAPMEVLARGFKYDQLNRISAATSFVRPNVTDFQAAMTSAFTWNGINASSKWATAYTYNADGDIKTLRRSGDNGPMDNLEYFYKNTGLNSHQLDYIKDSESPANYPMDIENQAPANYKYDPIGNLETDGTEQIQRITWNVYGKVKSVKRMIGSDKMNQWFGYNPGGQRIVKINRAIDPANPEQGHHTSFYALDAQGNILAIYENRASKEDTSAYEFVCTDQMIYGSSRIGMVHRNIKICEDCVDMPGIENSVNLSVPNANYVAPQPVTLPTYQKAALGTREYEFTNHLANVLTTLVDRKVNQEADVIGTGETAVVFQYRPEVVSSGEYYPFGMKLPGRGCTTPVLCNNTTTVSEEWVYIEEVFQHLTPIGGSGTVITPQTCNGNPCAQVETLGDQNGAEFGFTLNAGYHELVFDVETVSKTGDAEVRMVVLGYSASTGKFSDELAEYVNPPAGEQTLTIVGAATRDYKIRLEQRLTGTAVNMWRGFKVRITREVTTTDCQPGISTVTATLVDEKFDTPCTEVLQETFDATCTGVMAEDFGGTCTSITDRTYNPFGATTITPHTDGAEFTTNTTGHGLSITLPVSAGKTYTVRFNLDEVTTTAIDYMNVRCSVPGNVDMLITDNSRYVEYTFSVPVGSTVTTTNINIVLNGTGTKTATVSNFTFCENPKNHLATYLPYLNTPTFTYGGKLSFTTAANGGNGMRVVMPTVAGKTYGATFDYTKVSSTVTVATVTVAGSPALSVTASGTTAVEYVFTATGATTVLILQLDGTTGPKTAEIDNFTLCEYAGTNYGVFTPAPAGGLSATPSFSGGKATFTTAGSTLPQGVNINLPTVAGKTYRFTLDYTKTSSLITAATIQKTGGAAMSITAGTGATVPVEYTFTATGTTTTLAFMVSGNAGAKAFSIDNMALCAYPGGYNMFSPAGTLATPVSFTNGNLTVNTTANSGTGVNMALATTVGETYTVKFDFTKAANLTSATLQATGGTAQSITASGAVTYTFTATVASTNLSLLLNGTGTGVKTGIIDNLSVTYQTEMATVFDGYRFGFNGKEKVDEVYGDANAYDFGARIYDPRIGRWLSVDPLAMKYTFASPYNFSLNTPIQAHDPDGKIVVFANKASERLFNRIYNSSDAATKAKLDVLKSSDVTYNVNSTATIASGESGTTSYNFNNNQIDINIDKSVTNKVASLGDELEQASQFENGQLGFVQLNNGQTGTLGYDMEDEAASKRAGIEASTAVDKAEGTTTPLSRNVQAFDQADKNPVPAGSSRNQMIENYFNTDPDAKKYMSRFDNRGTKMGVSVPGDGGYTEAQLRQAVSGGQFKQFVFRKRQSNNTMQTVR